MAPLDKVRPDGDLLPFRVIEEDTTGGNKVLTYEGGSQWLKGTIIAGAASFVLQFNSEWQTVANNHTTPNFQFRL